MHELHQAALAQGQLDRHSYMMSNAEEFWAEAAQAWFHASRRDDVNCGIKTRQGVREVLPELAEVYRRPPCEIPTVFM